LTLQLYILRQLLVSFGFSLAGIGLLVVPSATIQAIHKLGGVSVLAVLNFLPIVFVELVPYVLPMAFLLGVVATFGRLAADKELIASAMAGVHPARALLPGLAIALALAGGTNWLLGTVSPEWKHAKNAYMRRAQAEAFRSLAVTETEMDFGKFFLKAVSAEGNVKKDVMLSLVREEGQEVIVVAPELELFFHEDVLGLELRGAQMLSEGRLANEAPSFLVRLDSLNPPESKRHLRAKYRPSTELRAMVASGELDERDDRNYRYEIHRRYALSMTYVLFLLLGIPTGILLRSGTQLAAFVGAMGYAFLYYVLAFRLGEILKDSEVLTPVLAAWSTNLLFLVAGAVLCFRTLWR